MQKAVNLITSSNHLDSKAIKSLILFINAKQQQKLGRQFINSDKHSPSFFYLTQT